MGRAGEWKKKEEEEGTLTAEGEGEIGEKAPCQSNIAGRKTRFNLPKRWDEQGIRERCYTVYCTVGGKGTFSVLWRKKIFVSNLLYVDVLSGLFKFCSGYFGNLQAKCQEKSL